MLLVEMTGQHGGHSTTFSMHIYFVIVIEEQHLFFFLDVLVLFLGRILKG